MTEWDHYGSGHASSVDCRLHPRALHPPADRYHLHGLVVLLCRRGPWYAIGEGCKTRNSHGGGASYLPWPGMIDELTSEPAALLEGPVREVLNGAGLVRVRAADLAAPLPEPHRSGPLPTLLTDPPHTWFDPLFYWAD